VRRRLNRKLEPLGYLLCSVDEREAVTESAREKLRKLVHDAGGVWPTEVRVDAQLKQAPNGHTRRSRGVVDYEAVADRLASRMKLTFKQTAKQVAVSATNGG
jgi:hypothetical protein